MDYKKKYEEALERARKINNGEGVEAPPDWTSYEAIFPELKESEDEKMMNSLIAHLRECRNNTRSEVMIDEYGKWIAFLEKKNVNKVDATYWPKLTNCIHDCKNCDAKCFYRKEAKMDENPKGNTSSTIWHLADDIPTLGRDVAMLFKNGCLSVYTYDSTLKYEWTAVVKWAYVDDLIKL